MENEIYVRNCPKCGKKIYYSREDNLKRDEKKNLLCKSCCRKGKRFSDEHRKKLSECKIGKKQSIIVRLKNSNTNKQRFLNDPSLKKKMSETSKRILHLPEIRKRHIEAMAKVNFLGKTYDVGQLELIEKWNRLGFNFQPNYQIHTNDFLCYIDGYDKKHNVILEYDAKYHLKPYQQKKDLVRQNKIIEIIKPKKFWRYNKINGIFIECLSNYKSKEPTTVVVE